jgi:putative colanic acid biosynthesis acetyltransferase WcaF
MSDHMLTTGPHRVAESERFDPYLIPAFGFADRLSRFAWLCAYQLLFRFTPVPLFRWRAFLLRLFGAKLGPANYIYPSARIWAPWLLETEDCVTVGRSVELYNPGGIRLNSHAIVSQGAFLCGASHDYDSPGFEFISAPIIVERYAWVCARAMVLMGVTVAEGAVLGAGAVAARSLEPWSVYAGNPAVRVKERKRIVRP